MFRWTIVQEAKKKKDSDTDITDEELDNVKKDKSSSNGKTEEDDIEATDYTEDAGDDGNSESEEVNLDDEDLDSSDYTEESEEDTEEDVESDDDTEGGDEDTDTDLDEEQSDNEETGNEDENQSKNSNLINDYIELYDSIKTIISRISSMNKTDLLKNRIIIQVSKNLNILLNTIYKYIIESFEKNTYVFNMYQFNLFIEAVNINIQMLKKSSELVSKK